jgi:hypothetical protein
MGILEKKERRAIRIDFAERVYKDVDHCKHVSGVFFDFGSDKSTVWS